MLFLDAAFVAVGEEASDCYDYMVDEAEVHGLAGF